MTLIIPASVNAATAGPRLAFAMAKSKFAALSKEYEDKGGKPVPSRIRALQDAFDRVESTFMAMLKDHPERDKIGLCVSGFVKFGAAVTQFEREGYPAFHPITRPIIATLFQMWEAAEKEYAAMGFKTIPARDLFLSLLPLGMGPKIHPPLYTFLMIERAPGEEPVYHAARFAEQYADEIAKGIEEAKVIAEKADAAAAANGETATGVADDSSSEKPAA